MPAREGRFWASRYGMAAIGLKPWFCCMQGRPVAWN